MRKPHDPVSEFEKRAANWMRKAICGLRIWRANDPISFRGSQARTLHRLEAIAGTHAPARSSLCGECPGCNSTALKPPRTLH